MDRDSAGWFERLGVLQHVGRHCIDNRIRAVYLTHFDLLDAPFFIAGESYGAWRASGVAEGLEQRGLRVAGAVLISGGIQMGPVSPDAVRTALFVPSRTAALSITTSFRPN